MRPKIICHMISSIDGRLLVDRWTKPAEGSDLAVIRSHYDAVAARFELDGWMAGRISMRDFADRESEPSLGPSATDRPAYIGDTGGRPLAIGLDPSGRLHYVSDDADGDHIVAIVGEHVSDDYLGELRQAGVSYLFAGQDGRDLNQAVEALGKAFGVKTLVLEGGGVINGAFLKAGLIDEISVLIYPGIDGLSGIPAIFEYAGRQDERPAEGLSLRHISTETMSGGVVWVHYAVEKSPGGPPKNG